MSDRRWSANSFDEARDALIVMLRSYRMERRNISRQKELLHEALDSLYAPSSGGCDGSIRNTPLNGDDAMMRTITRIEREKACLDREIVKLGEHEDRLNCLLRAVNSLPTFERRIIITVFIDGKSPAEACGEMSKSDDTFARYRKSALRKLTKLLYQIEAKTWNRDILKNS